MFTVDDDQIQQLEEQDTTVEMEPNFSPTVSSCCYLFYNLLPEIACLVFHVLVNPLH